MSDNVLTDIENYLDRFLYLGTDERKVLAAWTLSTWTFDNKRSLIAPYIYLNSPQKQCGKTQTLSVLETIVKNSAVADSITPAALFALIDKYKDEGGLCVFLDEVDATFYGRSNEQLRQIINSGYKKNGKAIRVKGGQAQEFSTFGPKILAGIWNNSLPGTILDRSIPLTLRRKPVELDLEYFNPDFIEDDIEELLEKVFAWKEQNEEAVHEFKFKRVAGMSDRQSEIVWPLLAVANTVGVDLESILLANFKAYEESEFNTDREFLLQIAEAFEVFGTRGKLHTETLLEVLDRPTNQASATKFAAEIAEYGVKPATSVRVGKDVKRGYTLEHFSQAFKGSNVPVPSV